RSPGAGAATAAGTGAGGGLPLVHALQLVARPNAPEAQASPQLAQALQLLANAPQAALAAASRHLPAADGLQVAARLMGLAAVIQEGGDRAAAVRNLIADHLTQLGHALRPGAGEEAAALRSALEQLVREGRPGVADQAQRVLHAMDGGQLLSA